MATFNQAEGNIRGQMSEQILTMIGSAATSSPQLVNPYAQMLPPIDLREIFGADIGKSYQDLAPAMVQMETADGMKIDVLGVDDDYRFIVVGKQIQRVRNVEGFLLYHKAHKGSLKQLLTNAFWALLLPENELSKMYNNSKVNRDFAQPITYKGDKTKYNRFVPIYSLVHHSLNWLQGILIEAYQADAFALISEAKKEALLIRQNELRIG